MATVEHDRATWLAMRRTGIGGSDAAAALEISKWKTQHQLYQEKIGEATTIESEAMKWGKIHEQNIRQEYCDQTKYTVTVPGWLQHPEHEFIVGTVDGLVNDNRVLEIKTSKTSLGWGEAGTNEIPDEYQLQCQHYMLLTGREICDVAVLIGGNEFRIYHVDQDLEMQAMMIEGYREFWQHVIDRDPPPITDLADIKQAYSKSVAGAVHADESILKACRNLESLNELSKKIDSRSDCLKAFIQGHMKSNDTLAMDGKILATWKSPKATSKFNEDKFAAEHPELHSQYTETKQSSRRFLLKELPPQGIEDHVNRTNEPELIGVIG